LGEAVAAPSKDEFAPIITSGWKSLSATRSQQPAN
jgi:hypothetical protein